MKIFNKWFILLFLIYVSSGLAQEEKQEINENSPVEHGEEKPTKETRKTINSEKKSDHFENKKNKDHEKEEDHHPTEVKVQISSDYIHRGWALGNEDISRRNNLTYKSYQPAWTFQPTIEFPTPIKHLYTEIFLNIWMVDLPDRDNEQRILQSKSGGPELVNRFQKDLNSGNFCTSSSPSSCYNPFLVHKYVNQNGMSRNNAGEVTVFYDFEKSKYGRFKTGAFRYAIFPTPNNGGLSKTQVYISWEFPFLEYLNPKLSIYKTVNFRNQGTPATGLNRSALYIPLELGHEFRQDKLVKIFLGTNIGYMYQANPRNKTSGFSDITTTLKFSLEHYYLSATYVKRPDVHLWDNNNYFDGATRLVHDGHVQDPSKLYGYYNDFIYSSLNTLTTDTIQRQYLRERYNQQRIVTNLFYISFGYSTHF